MPAGRHFRSELDLSKIDWARIDATTDADIARHAAENEDTSPIFTAAEILTAGRHRNYE